MTPAPSTRSATDRPVPVAAALPLAGLLTGPPTTGSVLGVFSAAVIAGLHTADGPRVVSLLGPGATGVPNGLRLPPGHLPVGLRPGSPVTVGGHGVSTGGRRFLVTRTWRTAAPAIRPQPVRVATVAAQLRDLPLGVPTAAVRTLADGLATGEVTGAVRGLLGLGAGLTPGGDDVLAGLLVGLRATGHMPTAQRVRLALGTDYSDATTAVSADLLRLAAAGHASTEVLAVLSALHRAPPSGTAPALDAALATLLAVGHTSGADTATGLLLGLQFPFRGTYPRRPAAAAWTPPPTVTQGKGSR